MAYDPSADCGVFEGALAPLEERRALAARGGKMTAGSGGDLRLYAAT